MTHSRRCEVVTVMNVAHTYHMYYATGTIMGTKIVYRKIGARILLLLLISGAATQQIHTSDKFSEVGSSYVPQDQNEDSAFAATRTPPDTAQDVDRHRHLGDYAAADELETLSMATAVAAAASPKLDPGGFYAKDPHVLVSTVQDINRISDVELSTRVPKSSSPPPSFAKQTKATKGRRRRDRDKREYKSGREGIDGPRKKSVRNTAEVAATTGGTRKWMAVTDENVKNMQSLTVLPEDGIIYCPIPKVKQTAIAVGAFSVPADNCRHIDNSLIPLNPKTIRIEKVASAEWKRALRWMVGIEDWQGEHSNLHSIVKNGLHRLVDWGLESTEWALNSDRFFKFVVVREPAERLVSAFLNKCVYDGYMSGKTNRWGSPNCAYLALMPRLFPNATVGSLETNERLRALVEEDPENTFFHFTQGVRREMTSKGGSCYIANHHFRPQFCSCQLHKFLPLFYVLPFCNMSTEAAAFADRLPQAFDVRSQFDEHKRERGQKESTPMEVEMAALGIGRGVDEPRREEIRVFLTERFERSRDTQEKVTSAAQQKNIFLSKRVMTVVQQIYAEDYDLFGEYFR